MAKLARFNLSTLSAAILAASSFNVSAQGNDADLLEEVVVTGIRGSLTEAMDIKREASGVVEAISAEDIGKFPDTNLAESLQRVTGVSIDRSNNEGNQVTVRGFGPSFNLVTMNGRQMPNSTALDSDGVNRSFNFKEIAAESVSGVEVYKSGQADISSGGIGATINIKTARPFDHDGFTMAGSVKGMMDSSNEEGDDVTPEVSAMVSTTFLDDMFGLLVSGSYAERNSQSQRVGTQAWVRNLGSADTDDNFWAPYTFDADVANHYRTRENAQVVLQFAPMDSLTATLDYVMSNYEENIDMNRTSYWFDNPESITDANGTATQIRNPNDELNFWAWDYHYLTENESIGLNVAWDVTDNLTLTFDAHDSTSHSQPDGEQSETIANLKNPRLDGVGMVDIGADLNGTGLPTIIYDDSDLVAETGADAYDPNNIVTDLFQKRGNEVENNIKQYKIAGEWDNANSGALRTIHFGVESTEYNVDALNTATFGFVNADISGLDLEFYELGDFGSDLGDTSGLFPYLVDYNAAEFIDIIDAQGDFFVNPPTINRVKEETVAAYLAFDLETEFNNLPITINAGVRYEDTDTEGTSVQNGIIALNYRNTEELQVIYDNNPSDQTLEGGYTRFLPNLDVKVELSEDWVARASYSKTLSRPDISAMFPATQISVARPNGPFNATQGNPGLLPYESENIDLSVEWYYAEGSYASVGYFKKYVDNFIGSTVEKREILDVNGEPLRDSSVNARPGCPDAGATPNPACLSQSGDPVVTWDVGTPGNLESTEVDGWEVNLQHMFGESGFGAIANATLVNADVEYDITSFDQTLALTGLSDSANLIGFYEKGGFQIRLAYNWRDDFLLSTGQPQNFNEPTFTEAYGQWDLNASYDINDNVSVFIEGLNITDETTRRHGRYAEQLLSAEQFGSRYTMGVRAKF
ncbi:TonB-dependent receptor [Gilvimarinus agarilyticus]|uniref:TonB-dependent receptor n=1 Tax=Gilvimarinus sp. 2_MG-2023 TaxID=3062666 RepID=UPI001C0A5E75|nr:TonB-dependent receptor [Gilvimarinus sp. 2_MG-2023]MBU2886395.1 TonB-dependent receptor [Gilvimarinus agarilyticus]MDO6571074.1 TonB-dependent receptor [Gilvimarinus sp. 2_MG-2023]